MRYEDGLFGKGLIFHVNVPRHQKESWFENIEYQVKTTLRKRGYGNEMTKVIEQNNNGSLAISWLLEHTENNSECTIYLSGLLLDSQGNMAGTEACQELYNCKSEFANLFGNLSNVIKQGGGLEHGYQNFRK